MSNRTGTQIITTPTCDWLDPDMLLGLRRSDAHLLVDGLRLLTAREAADSHPATAAAAEALADRLDGALAESRTLRAV